MFSTLRANSWQGFVTLAVLALGCESKGIDSESHFLCIGDSDCVSLDGGTCIEGRCRVTARAVTDTAGRSGATGGGGVSGVNGTSGVHGATRLDGATSSGGASSL